MQSSFQQNVTAHIRSRRLLCGGTRPAGSFGYRRGSPFAAMARRADPPRIVAPPGESRCAARAEESSWHAERGGAWVASPWSASLAATARCPSWWASEAGRTRPSRSEARIAAARRPGRRSARPSSRSCCETSSDSSRALRGRWTDARACMHALVRESDCLIAYYTTAAWTAAHKRSVDNPRHTIADAGLAGLDQSYCTDVSATG